MYIIDMCRCCLAQDVKLFEFLTQEGIFMQIKYYDIIKYIFPNMNVEEYSGFKVCEICEALLKGALILKNKLFTSQELYRNYIDRLKLNNVSNDVKFHKLTVDVSGQQQTSSDMDISNISSILRSALTNGASMSKKIKVEIEDANISGDEGTWSCENDIYNPTLNFKNHSTGIKEEMQYVFIKNEYSTDSSNITDKVPEHSIGTIEIANEAQSIASQSITSIFNEKVEEMYPKFNIGERICSKKNQTITQGKPLKCKQASKIKSLSSTPACVYKCNLCENIYQKKISLTLHTRVHTRESRRPKKDTKPFKCDFCDKTFIGISALKQHNRIVHIRERRFICHICCKQYTLKTELISHMGVHKGRIDNTCDICGKVFMSFKNLSQHECVLPPEKAINIYDPTTNFRVNSMEIKTEMDDFTNDEFSMDSSKNTDQVLEHSIVNIKIADEAQGISSESIISISDDEMKNVDLTLDVCEKPSSETNDTVMLEKPNENKNISPKNNLLTTHAYVYKCKFCEKTFNNQISHNFHIRTHTNT